MEFLSVLHTHTHTLTHAHTCSHTHIHTNTPPHTHTHRHIHKPAFYPILLTHRHNNTVLKCVVHTHSHCSPFCLFSFPLSHLSNPVTVLTPSVSTPSLFPFSEKNLVFLVLCVNMILSGLSVYLGIIVGKQQ